MWSVERIATEFRTFFACDHWRFLSTHVTVVATSGASTPRWVARLASVCSQNLFSIRWPPIVSPISLIGSCARISTWVWATTRPSSS